MSEDHHERSTDADVVPTAFVHGGVESGEHDSASVRAVTINRSRDELYAFWRDFSNLAPIMENVKSITVKDDRTSHWVVAAPLGATVEWDAIVTEDEPGRRIAWCAAEGADVDNSGWIEFSDGPTGRGTEVRAFISYDPPGGAVGKIAAKVLQREPRVQARRELRRFKQLMETGEITTSKAPDAAPRA